MTPTIDIPTPVSAALYLIAGFALISFGGVAGYWLGAGNHPVAVPVTPAQEVRQTDGSIIAERVPEAVPPAAALPHQMPDGAEPVRIIEVTAKPNRKISASDSGITKPAVDVADCEAVTLTVTLVDTPDGSRVIVASPDAEIVTARDRVFAPDIRLARRPWAAGISYDPFNESYGAWAERDFGRLRVGADLFEDRTGAASGIGGRVRLGLTFG